MENKLRQNAMKRTFFFIVFLAVAIVCTGIAFSESIDEFIDRFGKEFEAKKPAPYSTENVDYKLDQVALGALYTTKTLGLIYKQNETLMDKYDQLIMKYDKIIQQNEQIINLLSIIAKKEEVKE
jgi:hypothetical protein